jgi:hypothetical protein
MRPIWNDAGNSVIITGVDNMTLQERLDALAKRHAYETARLHREAELLSLLPAAIMDIDITAHPHKLWNRSGSIHLNYQRYSSIKGRQPTVDDVLLLADVFPPVPLCVYRDGCVSIRTADDPALHKGNGVITPIAPFWLRFSVSHEPEMSAHFIGQTGAGLVEFHIEFPLHSDTAKRIAWVRVNYEGHYSDNYCGERRIASSSLEVLKPYQIVNGCRAERINYSSGSSTTVGEKILYYDSANGEHANVTLADVLAE